MTVVHGVSGLLVFYRLWNLQTYSTYGWAPFISGTFTSVVVKSLQEPPTYEGSYTPIWEVQFSTQRPLTLHEW